MLETLKERIPGWGADLVAERRPGVPMERDPGPPPDADWAEPERQRGKPSALMTAVRSQPTPVFGTAVPPRGLSGLLRRYAYRLPPERPAHWQTLLFADRVDVLESAAGDFARRRPGLAALTLAALAAGAVALSGRRRRLAAH